jgi:hypothetical protein
MGRLMTSRNVRFFFASLLITLCAGCSEKPAEVSNQPKREAKAKKPEAPELKAGREALQTMYAAARNWSIDVQPVSLTSNPRTGDAAGRAQLWGASFASANKRQIRNFTWSGATGDDAPEAGVSQGSIDSYSPQNASTRPFDMNFLKIDSTQAFETAQKHGGAALLKKTPDMLVRYQLIWDARAPSLSWSVKYAPSGAMQKLDAVIDASTGQFKHIAK